MNPSTSLLVALATTIALLAGRSGMAQETAPVHKVRKLEDTPKLTVRGDAELDKPADQIRLRVGVLSEGDDAAQTLRENNRRMRAVVKAIEGAGLTDDEYETGQFRIRPRYSRRPRQANAEWRPTIVGYEVTNDVLIKTKRLELAGELIGAANEAGANSVDVLGFTLAEPRMYRAEAISLATKNAIADARALADAASLKLVRILSIGLDAMPTPAPEMMMQRSMAMADAGAGAPPISPGDVTVRASVTVVYEIAGGRD